MRPHVMEHVELFVLLQHGAEGIPPSPSPHLAQDPARSDLLTTSFVETPCCCQILIRLTGLITAGEGCQVLRPPDSICDETCLETLGKLSKSRLFLPSGRHVALLGGFLPLLLFYSRASLSPIRCACSEMLLFSPSPSPPSSPQKVHLCAGRRRLHAPPGSAASNRYRSRAPKKGWPAVMGTCTPASEHTGIPGQSRGRFAARAGVLASWATPPPWERRPLCLPQLSN